MLLENYIRNVLLTEKGRFSRGSELNAYLIGLNIDNPQDLLGLVDEINKKYKAIKSINSRIGYLQIYEKEEGIVEIIKKVLGDELVDDLGTEFNDDLPVIIRIIQGDNNPFKKKVGKLSLKDNLNWMVHDTWHLLVDRSFWLEEFLDNKNIHISETLKYYISRSLVANEKETDFEKDCLMFLRKYKFTPEVGRGDCVPSLAAFCVINRDIKIVPDEFKEKMVNYKDFNDFYRRMYVMGPLLWNSIFKSLKGKLIINHF